MHPYLSICLFLLLSLFSIACLFSLSSLFSLSCLFLLSCLRVSICLFCLFACLSYISGCWCGNQVGAFLPSNCGADPSIAALCGRSPRFCSGRAKRTLLARLSSLGGTFCHLIVAGGRGGVLESVRNPFPCFNVFVVCVWCVCTFYFAFLQFQML